jgi:hypothetical protein
MDGEFERMCGEGLSTLFEIPYYNLLLLTEENRKIRE